MERLTINTSKPYEILIGKNLLSEVGALCLEVLPKSKICLVTDTNVSKLYAQDILISLANAGFEPFIFEFAAGESSKNTSTLQSLVEYMARKGLSRTDAIFALGGGVVGDVAGFAAAIYMRGIKYIQMPTTLLACLDSSVGGKTGVDLATEKNYIGAFWQPSLVICDYSLLDTASPESFSDGMAEAIKYGAVYDTNLFQYLGEISPDLQKIISNCVKIKAKIVEEDERDSGIRRILNFGHTIGHAIEKCSNYAISHGHAVAAGMAIISRAAFVKGLSNEDFSIPIMAMLRKHSLPAYVDFSALDLASAALGDKKREGDFMNLVLLKSIGSAYIYQMSTKDLQSFIASGL